MDFTPSPAAEQFGDEVRALLARVYTDERRQYAHDTGTMHDWELHRAMADQGWIRQALPEALGGGGRGPEELAVLFRELELAGAPYDGMSICTMIASVLAHAGNEMQQREILPKLLSGESLIALGYSEPDAGSDVAAARTRAVRDGDGWRIDGQKIFTSLAEESEWVFLLTRTDLDVPKHRGLTFFLVPTSAPGFELQPIRTLSGKRTNMTFYDGVHVDDEWRVGEVDGGWQVMLVALSFERGVAGGVRDAERLLAVAEAHASTAVGDDGRPLLEQTTRRDALARLAIDAEVADLLAGRAAWVAASGKLPGVEGAASKLFATEAYQRSVQRLVDVAGPAGLVQAHDVTDLDAFYEYCYRFAPVTTIYGGTSEIQRNLIAQRGLGLPRWALTGGIVRGLPGLTLDPEAEAFRGELRAFLADALPGGTSGGARDFTDLTGWDETFERAVVRAAGEAGFLGVSLPVELGGGGRPPSWQAAVSYEAAYHDAPLIDTAAVLVAPTVATFGTAAQREQAVRAACAGTVNACIAYTEAGAGSDLSNITTSALETTALEPGDGGFVLDGEKVFVTGGHKADWCCTIARTDPSSSGRRGLSMFLIDMTTPGVVVDRHATANRWTLSTVRFEGAHVGVDAVLGAVGDGWRQLSGALLAERSGAAWLGWATRALEALLDHCSGTRDRVLRDALADLVTHWFAAVGRVERVLAMQDAGAAPFAEGALSKVCVTELLQRIARVGASALGPDALTAPGWFAGPLPGWFAYEVVERLHPALSVGANEIQRTTIADVGLGLPPEPRPNRGKRS